MLSAALHRAGLEIVYAPGALVASPDHTTARQFFGWARRQLTLTRVYAPRLWWMATLSSALNCAGMAAGLVLAFQGHLLGEYALLLLVFPGMLKGMHRAALARLALPEHAAWFKRYGWVHTWWAPLGTWAWLLACLASARSTTLEWRGRRYSVRLCGKIQ